MQVPFFAALGLDLSTFYPGTLNVSIAPLDYHVLRPLHTFRAVKWHPTEPAEDFSFLHCRLIVANREPVGGYIYHPHPETKPEHFQRSGVLELLLPEVPGLNYGMQVEVEIDEEQMAITPSSERARSPAV